jgi:hypothetical protein
MTKGKGGGDSKYSSSLNLRLTEPVRSCAGPAIDFKLQSDNLLAIDEWVTGGMK